MRSIVTVNDSKGVAVDNFLALCIIPRQLWRRFCFYSTSHVALAARPRIKRFHSILIKSWADCDKQKKNTRFNTQYLENHLENNSTLVVLSSRELFRITHTAQWGASQQSRGRPHCEPHTRNLQCHQTSAWWCAAPVYCHPPPEVGYDHRPAKSIFKFNETQTFRSPIQLHLGLNKNSTPHTI